MLQIILAQCAKNGFLHLWIVTNPTRGAGWIVGFYLIIIHRIYNPWILK